MSIFVSPKALEQLQKVLDGMCFYDGDMVRFDDRGVVKLPNGWEMVWNEEVQIWRRV